MCVKCSVNEAVNAGDWDEVARLAREEKKAAKTDEHDDVKAEAAEEKAAEKASSKAGR